MCGARSLPILWPGGGAGYSRCAQLLDGERAVHAGRRRAVEPVILAVVVVRARGGELMRDCPGREAHVIRIGGPGRARDGVCDAVAVLPRHRGAGGDRESHGAEAAASGRTDLRRRRSAPAPTAANAPTRTPEPPRPGPAPGLIDAPTPN